MEILIGLALGAGLLYVWLIGHWFGRVLAFLALAVVGFTIGMLAGDIVVAVIGVAVAWPIASIPLYRIRGRKRAAERAKQFVYPLHWTLGEINEYERNGTIAAVGYHPTAHFPAPRLR